MNRPLSTPEDLPPVKQAHRGGRSWSFLRKSKRVPALVGGWPALAVLLLTALVLRTPRGGPAAPAQGDGPAYLASAYHLHTDRLYSMSGAAIAGLGREPVYPLFLAGIMAVDPGFGAFKLACLASNTACPTRTYTVPRVANLALLLLSGVCLFLLARLLTGAPEAGLAACAYLLLDAHMQKAWGALMSDWLALFLVCVCMLALARAWHVPQAWRFAPAGLLFAALTLTKAIFLPFCVLAWLAAAIVCLRRRAASFAALAVVACVYATLVGGWALRNQAVSGMFRLTDARSGIALSTRAVFDAMSPRDYAASLVFWSGATGSHLAKRWFGAATASQFDLEQPGGYYDRGQNGYGRDVGVIMATRHLDYWHATALQDHRIVAGILHAWPAYLATMLPLTWRGLGIDEFLLLGLPCFVWATWHAARRRNWLLLLLFGLGGYNMLAYAALSLNIQRYQLTALPALSLGFALAGKQALSRFRERTARRGSALRVM